MGVIGIGNSLAGDDGAGPAVVTALERRYPDSPWLFLHVMDGDLFALSELLTCAPRFICVDAVLGEIPGRVVRRMLTPSHFAASLHQGDLVWVLSAIRTLGVIRSFPEIEIWGITIHPPGEFRESLSSPVADAVARMVEYVVHQFPRMRQV